MPLVITRALFGAVITLTFLVVMAAFCTSVGVNVFSTYPLVLILIFVVGTGVTESLTARAYKMKDKT